MSGPFDFGAGLFSAEVRGFASCVGDVTASDFAGWLATGAVGGSFADAGGLAGFVSGDAENGEAADFANGGGDVGLAGGYFARSSVYFFTSSGLLVAV